MSKIQAHREVGFALSYPGGHALLLLNTLIIIISLFLLLSCASSSYHQGCFPLSLPEEMYMGGNHTDPLTVLLSPGTNQNWTNHLNSVLLWGVALISIKTRKKWGLLGWMATKKSLEIRKGAFGGQLTGVRHQYSQTGLKSEWRFQRTQKRAEQHGQELLRGCHNFIRLHESVTGSFFLISPEHRHGCPVTLHQCLLSEHLSGCFLFVGGSP